MSKELKLSELNGMIKSALSASFPSAIWVVGEISELKIQSNGHCYLVLVEKEEQSDRIVAQARATIWSYTFRMLRPFFETTTRQTLTEGLRVLVQASVEFHELYGYSLNIKDIDPTYTLGDIARRRIEIIRRLTDEGVMEMNKELELPLVPQKIAIISSATAAGYQDFIHQLLQNRYKYNFYVKLFPALMQGEQAESSIIAALEHISDVSDFFDCVVIIRGGGAVTDLTCFDNYNMANHVAQFPIPVLTGIGHDKDETIVDMVAHTKLKTPTAVAEFLISGALAFDERMRELEIGVVDAVSELLEKERLRMERLNASIAPLVRATLTDESHRLLQIGNQLKNSAQRNLAKRDRAIEKLYNHLHWHANRQLQQAQTQITRLVTKTETDLRNRLTHEHNQLNNSILSQKQIIRQYLSEHHHQLALATERLRLVDPKTLLQRGYSITLINGKVIKNIAQISAGGEVTTVISNGSFDSQVTKIKQIKDLQNE